MTPVAIGLLLLLLALLLARQQAMRGRWGPGTEAFQSTGNPYNAPSPALYQALTFKLGRQRLIDDVESWAELRY